MSVETDVRRFEPQARGNVRDRRRLDVQPFRQLRQLEIGRERLSLALASDADNVADRLLEHDPEILSGEQIAGAFVRNQSAAPTVGCPAKGNSRFGVNRDPARALLTAFLGSNTNTVSDRLNSAAIVSATARLDFEGEKSATGLLDLKVHAGAIPGSATVGKLDLNASINGPPSTPTIDGAFDAGQIRVEQGSVDRVQATFRAGPDGPLTEEKTRILFEGEAKVNGLALSDPAFAQAVGRELTLTMRGSASSRDEMTFDTLDLSPPNFSAQYSGLLSQPECAVRRSGRVRLRAGLEDILITTAAGRGGVDFPRDRGVTKVAARTNKAAV